VKFSIEQRGDTTLFVSEPFTIFPGVSSQIRTWVDGSDSTSHVLQSTYGMGRDALMTAAAEKAIAKGSRGGGFSLFIPGIIFLVAAIGGIVFYFKKGYTHFQKGSKLEKKISKKKKEI